MLMQKLFAAALIATGLTMAAPSSQAAPTLTDPEIAHIAYTAGVIDINAAKLALKTSKNKEVLDFANNMVADHMAVNDKALALVKKLGVTPEDNDVSKSLVKNADAEQAKLAKLSGPEFDKAYAANELAYHKAVNAALKDTLIPNAANRELKDLLSQGLQIFLGHEQHAEMVVGMLK
jgi:putative membrane protein